MKKIPTLFERVYNERGNIIDVLPNVTSGMEWVLKGEGDATIKLDGSCCAIIDGKLYKRYDAKKSKKVPIGAIPCEEYPDPITGHFPHFVPCDRNNPSDKWFFAAFDACEGTLKDGTYEAVGKHFNGNPYGVEEDKLVRHGIHIVSVERSFDGIRDWLYKNKEEGLVFWKDGQAKCKIKRTDFGFVWK